MFEEIDMQNRLELTNREIFFVHINKTAGSSIEQGLGLKFQHKTATEFRDEVGAEQWHKGFSFSFVRNPWDKVVSHYHWRIKTNQTNLGMHTISFLEWVERTYGEQDPIYYDKPKMFMPQSHWLKASHSSSSEELIVDYIGKFETLQKDFEYVCSIVKLADSAELPHLKASERQKSYIEYYTPKTVNIIAQWFAEDIERFGYQFGYKP